MRDENHCRHGIHRGKACDACTKAGVLRWWNALNAKIQAPPDYAAEAQRSPLAKLEAEFLTWVWRTVMYAIDDEGKTE